MELPARLRWACTLWATAAEDAITVVFGDTLSSVSAVPSHKMAPTSARSLATCLGSPSVLATVSSTK
eukprot:4113782-Pyramimonas_sp.AAC.1